MLPPESKRVHFCRSVSTRRAQSLRPIEQSDKRVVSRGATQKIYFNIFEICGPNILKNNIASDTSVASDTSIASVVPANRNTEATNRTIHALRPHNSPETCIALSKAAKH